MRFIKFLCLIIFLNQLDRIRCWKKPVVNETKIIENNENYNKLLKNYLDSNQLKNANQDKDKDMQKYNPKVNLNSKTFKKPKLLVLGLDGFRYDYVDLYNVRVFKK